MQHRVDNAFFQPKRRLALYQQALAAHFLIAKRVMAEKNGVYPPAFAQVRAGKPTPCAGQFTLFLYLAHRPATFQVFTTLPGLPPGG